MKQTKAIPAEHAINWYIGNYIMNPNNELRENENILEQAHNEIEKLRIELKGKMLTHKEFLEFVKTRGIHDKYYRYKKYVPPYCAPCDKLGIPPKYR